MGRMRESGPTIKKEYDKKSPLTLKQAKLAESGYEKVKIIAANMFSKIKNEASSFQLDDFIGWGTEGLIQAAQRFDPSRNNDFSGYATSYISRRILDNLRAQDIRSRAHAKFLKDHSKAVELAGQEFGREPTEQEIAQKMNLTSKQYLENIKKYPVNAGIVSLSDIENEEGDKDQNSFINLLLAKEHPYDPNNHKISEDGIELLNGFLTQLKLDEKERQILNLCFVEGLTEREIGIKFGVSDMQISRIKNEIIEKLRKLFEEKGYKVVRENQPVMLNNSSPNK